MGTDECTAGLHGTSDRKKRMSSLPPRRMGNDAANGTCMHGYPPARPAEMTSWSRLRRRACRDSIHLRRLQERHKAIRTGRLQLHGHSLNYALMLAGPWRVVTDDRETLLVHVQWLTVAPVMIAEARFHSRTTCIAQSLRLIAARMTKRCSARPSGMPRPARAPRAFAGSSAIPRRHPCTLARARHAH